MCKKRFCFRLVTFMVAVVCVSQAQWVMVARAASKRIQSMTQMQPNGNGFEVATVMLEAANDKVYATALSTLQQHPGIAITKKDPKRFSIQFNDGKQFGTLQANYMGPKVTQLMIAGSVAPGQQSETPNVVNAVLRICKEMNVQCQAE